MGSRKSNGLAMFKSECLPSHRFFRRLLLSALLYSVLLQPFAFCFSSFSSCLHPISPRHSLRFLPLPLVNCHSLLRPKFTKNKSPFGKKTSSASHSPSGSIGCPVAPPEFVLLSCVYGGMGVAQPELVYQMQAGR